MSEDVSTGEMIKRARSARGWSQERLAIELGKVEGRGGKGPGRGQVYRWEKQGRAPKYWWPFLCEVLGFGSSDDAPAAQVDVPEGGVGDTVSSVLALGRSEVLRREFMASSSGYALAALGLPDLDSITRRVTANSGATVRVGQGEVLAVRQMVKSLGDAAAELGGGHARHLAVQYLVENVSPWLDGAWSESVGRGLFAGAAQLTHLIGWMAQDEGNHGVAQKYYAHSYRLAAEAGDAELAATALRGLAVQAIDLGYRAAAVRIAEECVDQAKRLDDPKALAYYETTLADAAAQDGDRTTATRFLGTSQRHIERSSPTPGDSWASHFSIGRWAHHSGMILAQLGAYEAAQEHLQVALDVHGLDRRRSHAIVLADLGAVQVRQENYGAALSTWCEFLVLAEGLRSVKVDDAVTDMRARLARIRTVHGATELDERAALFLAGRSV
ncbi:tetratricopeptide repeat protein [Kitasatospora sp. NPDC056800]|uniref:helix-turn-helix domain-containing protein n=1 Tax=Kitasatospora sp. NPDC056800 TaxID=3345948 RepID=UPI003693BB3D